MPRISPLVSPFQSMGMLGLPASIANMNAKSSQDDLNLQSNLEKQNQMISDEETNRRNEMSSYLQSLQNQISHSSVALRNQL